MKMLEEKQEHILQCYIICIRIYNMHQCDIICNRKVYMCGVQITEQKSAKDNGAYWMG